MSEPTPAQRAAMLASKIVGGLGLHEITEAQLAILMDDCGEALRAAQADATRAAEAKAYLEAAEPMARLAHEYFCVPDCPNDTHAKLVGDLVARARSLAEPGGQGEPKE